MSGAVNRLQLLKRRSSRMALNARVGLSGQDREKCTFTLSAVACGLNRHGAAVKVNKELLVGSTVVLRNSRRTQASARVVARVNAVEGAFTYGVEFLDHDSVKDFWGITFPSQS
jgi:PilZ domain